jgi:hypothetical protein
MATMYENIMASLFQYGASRSLWRERMEDSTWAFDGIIRRDGLVGRERQCPFCACLISGDHIAGKAHCKAVQARLRSEGGDYAAVDRVIATGWIYLPTRDACFNVVTGLFLFGAPVTVQPPGVEEPPDVEETDEEADEVATVVEEVWVEGEEEYGPMRESDMSCPICYEIRQIRACVALMPCGHFVCSGCWPMCRGRCPLCRGRATALDLHFP